MTESAADQADTDQPFTIEVTVAAPVEVVWAALRDPEVIRRWHGWHFDGLDEEIAEIFGAASETAPYDLLVGGGDRFTLTPHGTGTRVTMTRAPLGQNPEWDQYYDDINEGWTTFMQQLRFGLEQHPGQDRRTMFLDVSGPDLPDPTDLLRGSDLPAAGRTWFTSAHQLGVTVDALGPGLVVVGSKSGTPGGAMAIVTGYGLDDAEWERTRAEWNGWWRAHYPAAADPV